MIGSSIGTWASVMVGADERAEPGLSCYHWAGTMASIARRALALTGVIVAPLVALAAFGDHRGSLGILALAWAALGLALVWLSWNSISRRVFDLTQLADRMPD